MIRLSGRLVCADMDERAIVLAHLADHIRLTRAEPGCLGFDVAPTDDPLVWSVEETFADRAAFDGHQARTQSSDWYRATAHIKRDYRTTGL